MHKKATFTAPKTKSVLEDSSTCSETDGTPREMRRGLGRKDEQTDTKSASEKAPNPALANMLHVPAPIDEAAAKKQFGSTRMVQTMLKRFASYLPETLEKLREAHAAGDFAALHAQGHSLKGSSSFVAAKELCDCATQIQNLCRPESVKTESEESLKAQLDPVMKHLEASSKRVSAYLEHLSTAVTSSPVKPKKNISRKKRSAKKKQQNGSGSAAESASESKASESDAHSTSSDKSNPQQKSTS